MRTIEVAGRTLDAGPTVFTMRWVFEALFADAGENLTDHLALIPATTLARHAWAGGQSLDLFADRERSADAIGAFAGASEAKGYRAFCKEAGRIYETLERRFIAVPRPSMAGLALSAGLRRGLALKPFEILWDELGRHFKDKRLRQLFGRYSTYVGTSPFQAPATLMLIAHVEQQGVWLVDGGMHKVAQALAGLAQRRGATIRYDTVASEVVTSTGRVSGVRLPNGEIIEADAVVFNGEPGALGLGQLGDAPRSVAQPLKFPQRSLSAVTWGVLAETSGLPLLRHTVFFSQDYATEFKMINQGLLPTEPTTYICAQDRVDEPGEDGRAGAPPGAERLLILVNAPPTGDRRAFSQVEIDQCMQGIMSLMARSGARLQLVAPPTMTTPAAFSRLFPGAGGALYGAATIGATASFSRPASRTSVQGLYLAGGSVHPGAGIPMATLSGRHAAARVLQDLVGRTTRSRASTKRSRTADTAGGMSTP